MSAWTGRVIELIGNNSALRKTIEERGKYFMIEKEARVHPQHGMVITCYDEDGYRFTTSVRNVRFPQPEDLQRGR